MANQHNGEHRMNEEIRTIPPDETLDINEVKNDPSFLGTSVKNADGTVTLTLSDAAILQASLKYVMEQISNGTYLVEHNNDGSFTLRPNKENTQ